MDRLRLGLIGSGLLALISLTRTGIRHFWTSHNRTAPVLSVLEGAPIALLLGACIALTVQAPTVMDYANSTAQALHTPASYVQAVLSARPVPNPTRAAPAMPLPETP